MHLIFTIVIALLIFRWVTTKPRRRCPIEGMATIHMQIVRTGGPIDIAEAQKLRP